MRTVVVSDLHLGAVTRADLLRRPELHAPLLDFVRGAGRVVILGDAVELRDRPQRDVAAFAAPLLRAIGETLGPGGELVLVPGNHDHGLIAGWIEGRLQTEPSGFLPLEQRMEPAEAGRLAGELARLAAPAHVTVAYPGLWLRDDVYATHGHYSDVHTTVPTFERLAAGAMVRWIVDLPGSAARPDDYEAVLGPIYAFIHTLVQRSDRSVISAGAGASARAWVALSGGNGRGRRSAGQVARAAAMGGAYAAGVGAVNRSGIGPVRRDLSGAALRQGGLRGMGEVVRRLEVGAAHVIWGHSHRSGPWPGDVLAEWTAHGGARLHNTGSWVYQRHFVSGAPNESPYWPGTAIELDDGDREPPRLRRLLGDRGHAELAPR